MKKTTKIISVILAVVMLASCLSVLSFATQTRTNLPTILMAGQGACIFKPDGTQVYPINADGVIGDAANECLPLFKDAITSGDYSEWSAKINEYVDNVYKDIRLDKNGEASDGSYIVEGQLSDAEIIRRASWKPYNIDTYYFCMDWRLDPFDTAAKLKDRIEKVKAACGVDKVNLICRCEANNVFGAYLAAYGSDDINSVVLYVSTLGGCEAVSGAFSGNIDLDAAALTKYYNNADLTISDEILKGFIDNTIGFMLDTYTLEVACAMLKPVIRKLYKEAVYECILNSYGTFPGIWALVTAKDYEAAKAGVFAGKEEEYAGLIEKLDHYDKAVRQCYPQLLKAAEANGTSINVVAKYGDYQMIPVCSDNNMQNDGVVSLTNSSFGAATAAFGKQIPASYITKAEANGTAKYISADLTTDASTCLFPDNTWIICGLEHRVFPESVNELMMKIVASDGEMTVWSDENYPQFMSASENTASASLTALTAENGMQPEAKKTTTKSEFLQKLYSFLRSAIVMILRLFNGYYK